MSFSENGFQVFKALLTQSDVALAGAAVKSLVERHRARDCLVTEASVSIGQEARRRPERNPGAVADELMNEPFIIGDLVALDDRFRTLLSRRILWDTSAKLLGCSTCQVQFHFSNVTRKPARFGPAIAWHRDAQNKYIAPADRPFLRLLLPLQPVSEHNGGTELHAGSHLRPQCGGAAAPICPPLDPGDGLAIHSNLLHGGSPNRSERDRDLIVLQFGVEGSQFQFEAVETMSYRGLTDFC